MHSKMLKCVKLMAGRVFLACLARFVLFRNESKSSGAFSVSSNNVFPGNININVFGGLHLSMWSPKYFSKRDLL